MRDHRLSGIIFTAFREEVENFKKGKEGGGKQLLKPCEELHHFYRWDSMKTDKGNLGTPLRAAGNTY